MVEFCEKCDGMMLPSKDRNNPNLVCNLCGHTKPLKKGVIQSYNFNTEIYHPPGDEFKNLEKMKEWKKDSNDQFPSLRQKLKNKQKRRRRKYIDSQ